MLPLVLIAFGIGAVAFVVSSGKQQQSDDHANAVSDAGRAHDRAEAHMEAATQALAGSGDPVQQQRAAQDHTKAAQAATAVAAQKTAQAAQTAQNPTERMTALWNARLTLAQQDYVKAFTAFQIAKVAGTPTDVAQTAMDSANARIAEAKAELSKLAAQQSTQQAQLAQSQTDRAIAAWTSAMATARQEESAAQTALARARADGKPTAGFERNLDSIRARIAEARSELIKLGVRA